MRTIRAKHQTESFAQLLRSTAQSASARPAAAILDAAFADYSRVDAGTAQNQTPATSLSARHDSADSKAPAHWHGLSRKIVDDIAAQLDALDGQRQQLARLLQSVEIGATTD